MPNVVVLVLVLVCTINSCHALDCFVDAQGWFFLTTGFGLGAGLVLAHLTTSLTCWFDGAEPQACS